MKEAEFRLADIRKAKSDFERRVLKPMKDNRIETKDPGKVLQYFEDKLKVTKKRILTSTYARQHFNRFDLIFKTLYTSKGQTLHFTQIFYVSQ